jgi:hypothetical protein
MELNDRKKFYDTEPVLYFGKSISTRVNYLYKIGRWMKKVYF